MSGKGPQSSLSDLPPLLPLGSAKTSAFSKFLGKESRYTSRSIVRSIPHTTPSIAELQANWHQLLDPDRARAIFALHRAHFSYRKLAAALNCSESLLRHLLKMLEADPEDFELAQQLLISTNECVRRGEQAYARREASRLQEMEIKRVAMVAKVTRGSFTG